MTNENKYQAVNLGRKDLVNILQNHKSAALKDSQKRYEDAAKRIDACWNDVEYDAYQINNVCLITQLRISGWGMVEENFFMKGKYVEAAVSTYDSKDGKYNLAEYGRGDTPKKAYNHLIERLQKD